ncbi:uncharacterized protein [Oryza sativa Japonica Group]|uniref:uncharacterized protein n=1 Tax=Oryza sativa subsp. japonica TaxID=39947 RepID=UPI0001C7E7FA|nr:uncharacterized protein LOC107280149 isoform X1 [Oryza sativa Japonica Group]
MADLGGRSPARLTPRPPRRARHRPQGAWQAQARFGQEVAGDGEVNGGAGCMFNVVPGLDGKPGSVSLELGSKPGCFLVAGASTKVQLSILEETGDGEVNGGGGGMGTDAQLISAGRRSQGHSRRSRSTVAREERGERVEEREMGRE